ncbi:hypothetical protein [Sphingobacterium kyonggiense]|uniref:hypothetical protein n=1 Tax=Sphingobacterium kyonggiense TaxID=714075 RepID=UPI0031DC6E0C
MPFINKHIWRYYLPILYINIVLTLLFGLMGDFGYLAFTPFLFATVGFFGALGLVLLFERNSIYMYYNLGLSRRQLILSSLLINFLIAVLLYLFVYYGVTRST